jgi:hypothetical protein
MERRRSMRIVVEWELTLRHGDKVIRATARQFNEYGMLVSSPTALEIGQRYHVSFSLPGEEKVFAVRGFAVYSNNSGVGVRFELVPPEITAEFRRFVNAIQPGQARGAGAGL